MALKTQIYMLSVDTGHFFSKREARLHRKYIGLRQEQSKLKDILLFLDEVMVAYGFDARDLNYLKAGKLSLMKGYVPDASGLQREYLKWQHIFKHKARLAKAAKEGLLLLLSRKVRLNEQAGERRRRKHKQKGLHHVRTLREHGLSEKDVVAVFESSLTRMLGAAPDTLTDALMVVQIYYFDIFKDLSYWGFVYKGERYRYFTSSAGQIRKKKALFIKETLWQRWEKTILCGLTIDKINARGGNNANKHLAYMALSNSATDVWTDFDIDKSIVIDDFETEVYGSFDFIDDEDYSVTRKTGCIPIPHTDGAGMALPGELKKTVMFRAPWIKGLLGIFDFAAFIKEHGCSPVIKDIYGTEHDVIAEDIRIIFTRSQFKMYRYYDSWEEYKSDFKKYGCTAGLCNEEEERIPDARLNYQMLQTLTDVTDKELKRLAQKSVRRLKSLCESKENLLAAFGVTPYNQTPTPLQQALALCPDLLWDEYLKIVIRSIKDSLVKEYRAGRLEVEGKYTFILPDFYAACEYWFAHRQTPEGLLEDGEVYCRLYPKRERLDCLRSPHLYREHAIRTNAACTAGAKRREKLERWFPTNALYTSCHDLISKLLQFDVDGDKALVVADEDFVGIAKRHMEGIVPLYYNMRKASPAPLNSKNIYSGLHAAFVGGNIGRYSNDISKIWNSPVFLTGSSKERLDALEAIKLLCMENNFVIDYAKTLYKPARPAGKASLITRFTNAKLPAFFIYAKDKETGQTEPANDSTLNRLSKLIPNPRLNFSKAGLKRPDYRLLMKNPDTRPDKAVVEKYSELNRLYHFKINMQDENVSNLSYIASKIRAALSVFGYSEETVADMLVRYLYGKESRSKEALWFCYGKYLAANLSNNLGPAPKRCVQCIDCGDWFEVALSNRRTKRCPACQSAHKRAAERIKKQRQRNR